VISHVWSEHGIILENVWKPVVQSEDARIPPEETQKRKLLGFRCEDCRVLLESSRSLIDHLDKKHGVHIWYEKGLDRKRVYFDGVLDTNLRQQKLLPTKRNNRTLDRQNIPLSKRPYEPRKSKSS
jgi:hypothetical protein